MNDTQEASLEPFTGGPYARLLASLGLPPAPHIARRTIAVVGVAWLPLVVLAALQGHAYSGDPKTSLLTDAQVNARYLVAAPLLLVAESVCLPVMAQIVRHFAERGLIADDDRGRYAALLHATRRLLNSRTAEIIFLALVAAGAWLSLRSVAPGGVTASWRGQEVGGAFVRTYAGWWNALVSYPLYLFLLYGWLWRLFLWGRCLFTLSRLNLRLQPGHPDRVGGLGFVNAALSVLPLLAFAFACVPAGAIADRLLYAGKDIADFKAVVIAFVALVVALLAGPLLFFGPLLRRTRTAGIFRYGLLASLAARRAEQGGTPGGEPEPDADSGTDTDFAEVTERFTNAKEMRLSLVDLKSLTGLIAGVCLPFLPVLLIQVPLADILEKLKGLIL